MFIEQISVFVENKFGRLAKIVELFSKNDINLGALSIADTTDFGILRIIVDKPDLALKVLKENGITAKSTEVIAVAIENQPGGLSKVLDTLTESEIAIEYMYAFVGKVEGKALMVVKTDKMAETVDSLTQKGVEIFEKCAIF